MEPIHIDTVPAAALEAGDIAEFWDGEAERYVLETITSVEDDGKFIEIYTEENPDGIGLLFDLDVRIFSY